MEIYRQPLSHDLDMRFIKHAMMIRRDPMRLESPGREIAPRSLKVKRILFSTEEDDAARVDPRHIRSRRPTAGVYEVERPETLGHATPGPQIERANHLFELSPKCARRHVGELLGRFQEPKPTPVTRHIVTETRDPLRDSSNIRHEGERLAPPWARGIKED